MITIAITPIGEHNLNDDYARIALIIRNQVFIPKWHYIRSVIGWAGKGLFSLCSRKLLNYLFFKREKMERGGINLWQGALISQKMARMFMRFSIFPTLLKALLDEGIETLRHIRIAHTWPGYYISSISELITPCLKIVNSSKGGRKGGIGLCTSTKLRQHLYVGFVEATNRDWTMYTDLATSPTWNLSTG